MSSELDRVFARVRDLPDFENVDFSDINAERGDGDTALHVVVHWGDISGVEALIAAGIDVNKAGDLGYTALHIACMTGNIEMIKLLVDHGADLFAMSEGDTPFTSARLAGHNSVCDFLAPLMQRKQLEDPKTWVRARIAQLRREIAALEKKL